MEGDIDLKSKFSCERLYTYVQRRLDKSNK